MYRLCIHCTCRIPLALKGELALHELLTVNAAMALIQTPMQIPYPASLSLQLYHLVRDDKTGNNKILDANNKVPILFKHTICPILSMHYNMEIASLITGELLKISEVLAIQHHSIQIYTTTKYTPSIFGKL